MCVVRLNILLCIIWPGGMDDKIIGNNTHTGDFSLYSVSQWDGIDFDECEGM